METQQESGSLQESLPAEPAVYSVAAFAEAHGFARSYFYVMLREGTAPKTFKLGRRRLITREEAQRWRERMVAESVEGREGESGGQNARRSTADPEAEV